MSKLEYSVMRYLLPVSFILSILMYVIVGSPSVEATTSPASSTTLYNATGGTLGYIDSGSGKVAVRDSGRAVIGYVDNNGTYDKSRKTIAKSRLPGLLFR